MPNEPMTARRPFGDLAKRNMMTPEQVFSSQGRIPPQATDLEEVVLGALMLEKEAVNEVIDILHPKPFISTNTRRFLPPSRICSENLSLLIF